MPVGESYLGATYLVGVTKGGHQLTEFARLIPLWERASRPTCALRSSSEAVAHRECERVLSHKGRAGSELHRSDQTCVFVAAARCVRQSSRG
jgi:hypothetical protein